MGFLSANCEGCHHPILSAYATNAINQWMNVGVAITPSGEVISGFYDGYGNLDQRREFCAVGDQTTVWHEACWIAAGSPAKYRGPSRLSDDQGWFFDEGAHDMEDPSNQPIGESE